MYRAHLGVIPPQKSPLLVLPWFGVLRASTSAPGSHTITQRGVGIHIEVGATRHLDEEEFANRLGA